MRSLRMGVALLVVCFAASLAGAESLPDPPNAVLEPQAAPLPAGEPEPQAAPLPAGEPEPLEDAPAEGEGAAPETDPFDDEDDWLFDDAEIADIGGPDDPAERDPFQALNRGTFAMNEAFLRYVADPVSSVYEFIVPDPGRRAIRRFFRNLEEPVIFVNDVLQLAPVEAAETASRFVVNSTVGIVGFFDPARHIGLEGHFTDFGETLAVYYAPPGPYLVVPILGPATVRDALGEAVDGLLRPDIWLLGTGTQVLITTGDGLATYDIQRDRLEALRETSVDFYSAMRSAYLMDRDAQVEERLGTVGWRSALDGAGHENAAEPLD